jgi:hypothetical protein
MSDTAESSAAGRETDFKKQMPSLFLTTGRAFAFPENKKALAGGAGTCEGSEARALPSH